MLKNYVDIDFHCTADPLFGFPRLLTCRRGLDVKETIRSTATTSKNCVKKFKGIASNTAFCESDGNVAARDTGSVGASSTFRHADVLSISRCTSLSPASNLWVDDLSSGIGYPSGVSSILVTPPKKSVMSTRSIGRDRFGNIPGFE